MAKEEVATCVKRALSKLNLSNFEIDFTGTSSDFDGYLGDINFLKVKCQAEDGNVKELRLAVKTGKLSEKVRRNAPVRDLFVQEIRVYTEVFRTFKTFVREKSVVTDFDLLPKCYDCFVLDHLEVIILQDLTADGFRMHDRKVPLSIEHLKLLMEAFGRFHAMSYVLQDQKKDDFEQVSSKLKNPAVEEIMTEKTHGRMIRTLLNGTLKIFNERNKMALHDQLEQYLKKDVVSDTFTSLNEDTKYYVVTHGDAWNNNFMFHYSGENEVVPDKISIIDWQLAVVRNTPVCDLSLALYNCISPQNIDQLETLLYEYYTSFSQLLIQLGSNPERIYTFQTLKDEWNKFSFFGLMFAPYILKQTYWDQKEYDNMECSDWVEKANRIVIKDDRYYERLVGAFEMFFNYKV